MVTFSNSSFFKSTKAITAALVLGTVLFGAGSSVAYAKTDKAVIAAYNGQKAKARGMMHKRSVWGHFRAMDSNNSWSLTFKEMDQYFTAMHLAFDVNGDGIVSVREAPKIMLKYTLSGEPFPNTGLSQSMLRGRLQRLFRVLDKNRNNVLSVSELT